MAYQEGTMKSTSINGVKMYTVVGQQRSLASGLNPKKRRALRKDQDQIVGAQEFDTSCRKENKKNKKGIEIDKDAIMTSNKGRVGEKEKSRKKRHKEEERIDAIACDEKVGKKEMTNNVLISDHDKRQQEHQEKKKRKKQKRDDTLNGCEDEKQMEKRKKKKMDGLMLFHESKAERKKGKKDVMKADDKEKVEKKRKAKKTKDDVIAGDEEHKKKVKEKKKNVKESGYEVEDGKETIANQSGNKAEIPEGRRDGGKKRKLETIDRGGKANSEGKATKKKTIAADTCEHPTPQSKKVRFSDEVEVFPPPDPENNSNETGDGLVRGKRFSKKEDAIIRKAVSDYIEANHLGEAGLDMILHCQSHPKIRDCWREISAALPWRPYISVYYRAHILYERGDRNWTPEELELIRKSYEKHGSNWKIIAKELGKFRVHVKDAWRRIKLVEMKRGNWSQDEYQVLFELVNKDLQMKVYEEKNSKHGMLRDNISWEAISTTLGTRQMSSCCLKWYKQLTSPMVAEGKWADADDYRLLMMLVDLDASCKDEVDWDCLLEHRSGDLCRRRWDQMVNHLGEHGNKSFSEQVEVLSNRYCPDLVEVREAVDARPIVD